MKNLYKHFKNKIKNFFKIIFFTSFKNTVYKIDKLSDKEIIVDIHLGLGDIIILNGLINRLSKKYLINLPVLHQYANQVDYLFSENSNVKIFKVENKYEVASYNQNFKILRIGYEKNESSFNTSFYKQLNLPYSVSFSDFYCPQNTILEQSLYDHLMNFYDVKNKFILVHNTSSYGSVNLSIKNNYPIVYVEKNSDIHSNIFLYRKLILNAAEIHCIDSSFLHLVERMESNGKLFFHNFKTQSTKAEHLVLNKKWSVIN